MEQCLSLISLGVKDVAEAITFYNRMGLAHVAEQSNYQITFFQMGGVILGLYGRDALAEDATLLPSASQPFNGVSIAYNAREKADVDTVLAEAKAAGGTIVKPAEDAFWGGYSGYFTEPDGHLWEIAWNPFFPITGDGRTLLEE
jgi:uncharacterized protein